MSVCKHDHNIFKFSLIYGFPEGFQYVIYRPCKALRLLQETSKLQDRHINDNTDRRKINKSVWIERRKPNRTVTNSEGQPEPVQDEVLHKIIDHQNSLKNILFAILVTLIVVLNVADYFLTYVGLSLGAREVNPIMDKIISMGWEYVTVFKAVLIGISILILWHLRHLMVALWVAVFGVAIYAALFLYHIFQLGSAV